MESPRSRPPRIDPRVMKVIMITLIVIALTLVALVVLVIIGLMYLLELIELIESLPLASPTVLGYGPERATVVLGMLV